MMIPRMSEKEIDLFNSFIRNSSSYVEFGAGGSTFVASNNVQKSIISIDSSVEWLSKVKSACVDSLTQPRLVHVDIGPTGDWGVPTDKSTQSRWPRYHEIMWEFEESRNADLYFIDGRFRVACFAQTVKHCNSSAIIGFHDFSSRSYYHCVREIAREIATAEDLSFFQPKSGVEDKIQNLIEEWKFIPA